MYSENVFRHAVIGFLLGFLQVGCAQELFKNLDFEQAQIVPVSPELQQIVYASNAIPNWTFSIGGWTGDRMPYNTLALGDAALGIHDTNSPHLKPLEGHYSVLLQPSWDYKVFPVIYQSGTIPASSKTLFFLTASYWPVMTPSFERQLINIRLVASCGKDAWLWAGDISSFAGQTGLLAFGTWGVLDAITFSSEPLPEPQVLSAPVFRNEGAFEFQFSARPGLFYRFQRSTNFHDWITFTNVTGAGSMLTIRDSTARESPVRLYRAISP